MTSSKNLIVIVGATGVQGSSVAQAFLSLSDWHVRAVTRNTSSDAAKALAAKGAEVVQADLMDRDSLVKAFTGATDIFLNTDFWAPYAAAMKAGEPRDKAAETGHKTELTHTMNAADAAARVPGLRRLVYSALGPMKKASKGKFAHCHHWDAKAESADYIEQKPELAGKASFIYPGAYHTNAFLLPKKVPGSADGYSLMLPGPITTRIPITDMVTSFGLFVRALILEEDAGVKLLAADCEHTFEELIQDFDRFTRKKTKFVQETETTMHDLTGLPFEVLDGPAFLAEFSYMDGVEGRVIGTSDLKIQPPTKTFAELLAERGLDDVLGNAHADL